MLQTVLRSVFVLFFLICGTVLLLAHHSVAGTILMVVAGLLAFVGSND